MSSDHDVAGGPNPALVFDALFAYQRTAALRAAIEIDLFRAIGEGRRRRWPRSPGAAPPPSAGLASFATSSRSLAY